MIQPRTILYVADNSGAKTVRCIGFLGGSKRGTAKIGDTIVVSVQQVDNKRKNLKIKKGQVLHGVVVTSKQPQIRKNGQVVRFDKPFIVLLNEKKVPIGNRILYPIGKELKDTRHLKIISLATQII